MRAVDPDVHVTLTKLDEKVEKVFAKETQKQLISSLFLIPSGIQSMSMDIKGLVESSTNLGVIETLQNEIKLRNEVRSSVSSLKQHVADEIKCIAELVGATFEIESAYPEWYTIRTHKFVIYLKKCIKKNTIKMLKSSLYMQGLNAVYSFKRCLN